MNDTAVLDEIVGLARHYEEQAQASPLNSPIRTYLEGKAWAFKHAAFLLRGGRL